MVLGSGLLVLLRLVESCDSPCVTRWLRGGVRPAGGYPLWARAGAPALSSLRQPWSERSQQWGTCDFCGVILLCLLAAFNVRVRPWYLGTFPEIAAVADSFTDQFYF